MIGDKTAYQDIFANQGATFRRTITLKDQNGITIDLTGSQFAGQVRRRKDSSGIAVSMAFQTNTEKTSVEVSISAAALSTMACGLTPEDPDSRYVYDIEWTRPGGDVTRIMEGRFILSKEVTR